MRRHRTGLVPSLLLVGVLVSSTASAGLLSKIKDAFASKHRASTLIVAGNYVRSRLLAELIQRKIKQPILLVTEKQGGTYDIYYMPYGPDAVSLERDNLVEFTDLLNPKRIVVIGDSTYVPTEIVSLFEDRFPSVKVDSPNWAKNAESLATLFRYRSLPRHFADLLKAGRVANDDRLSSPILSPDE